MKVSDSYLEKKKKEKTGLQNNIQGEKNVHNYMDNASHLLKATCLEQLLVFCFTNLWVRAPNGITPFI